MSHLPTWAQLSIIASTVLLSPVLAFLAAVALEILVGILAEAGLPTLITLVVTGLIGWSLLQKLRMRPPGSARH